jgi:hypothetical protein
MNSKNKKTKKKAVSMKPLNQNIPTYEQTADIIIPAKVSKDIKPKEIFEGLSKATNVKDDKPKKRPAKKGGKRTKK